MDKKRQSEDCLFGAGNVTRTRDLRITNALLYQLSYSSECKYHYTQIDLRNQDL